VADLTRRAFIGRTLLTGATIASGGLATLSTSPTTPTVAKVATTFKNLNVLSPKAKAYKTFLKGIVGGAEMYQKHRPTGRLKTSVKTLLTKHSAHNPKTGNIERVKASYGRSAFETAIKKPEGSWTKMEARQGVGNPGARNIAISMKTNNREAKQGFMDPKNTSAGKESRTLTARLTKGARLSHADELKAFRKANPERMHKKKSAQIHKANIQATKTTSTTSKGGGKSGGGGGGKFGGNTFGRHSPWSLLRNDKNF